MSDEAMAEKATDEAARLLTRIARVVARLPRLTTDEEDYSWVPLGDVLVAIMDIERAEAAWPEGPPMRSRVPSAPVSVEDVGRDNDG